MIHVYLDDSRPCPSGFVLARDAVECIALLEECEVDILSLDHDLGWMTKQTGMDVAEWLVQTRKFPQTVYIHTSSPWACKEMFQLLNGAKPEGMTLFPHKMPDELLLEIAHGRYKTI
ncbi:cyclic-phosphate processing receiver domain-containing protein [Paenibacillus whitsoniae]|uniref:Cell division protein FtsJ n=1 Tax=Paenibacillus whitsoniae TaxID=2496558 RepID=A0A430J769_9BACL|nr:cyclic-phosphate processing receiver domain-containing protein [Paenibacillus whitsoniae]RTE05404.1 cell division protein FtsJ [Paenibacillus whitsoniae]